MTHHLPTAGTGLEAQHLQQAQLEHSPRNERREEAYRSSLSAFTLLSTSMSLEPASSCITSPEVTIGLIPSSMQVPLHRQLAI